MGVTTSLFEETTSRPSAPCCAGSRERDDRASAHGPLLSLYPRRPPGLTIHLLDCSSAAAALDVEAWLGRGTGRAETGPSLRQSLNASPCVGLDTEWTEDNPLSTIQVAFPVVSENHLGEERVLVVALVLAGEPNGVRVLPPTIAGILAEPGVLKVGVGVAGDMERILMRVATTDIAGWCDLRSVANGCESLQSLRRLAAGRKIAALMSGVGGKRYDSSGMSLSALSLHYCSEALEGVPLDKSLQGSDWDAGLTGLVSLTRAQVEYAGVDAWAGLATILSMHRHAQPEQYGTSVSPAGYLAFFPGGKSAGKGGAQEEEGGRGGDDPLLGIGVGNRSEGGVVHSVDPSMDSARSAFSAGFRSAEDEMAKQCISMGLEASGSVYSSSLGVTSVVACAAWAQQFAGIKDYQARPAVGGGAKGTGGGSGARTRSTKKERKQERERSEKEKERMRERSVKKKGSSSSSAAAASSGSLGTSGTSRLHNKNKGSVIKKPPPMTVAAGWSAEEVAELESAEAAFEDALTIVKTLSARRGEPHVASAVDVDDGGVGATRIGTKLSASSMAEAKEALSVAKRRVTRLRRRKPAQSKAARNKAMSKAESWECYPPPADLPRDRDDPRYIQSFAVPIYPGGAVLVSAVDSAMDSAVDSDVDGGRQGVEEQQEEGRPGAAARAFFNEWGFVIFRDVLTADECIATEREIWESLEAKTAGLVRDDPSTHGLLSSKR